MKSRTRGRLRQHTPVSELYSDEEMDQRIRDLAARVGIGRGEMVVRHVAPTVKPDVHAAAAEAVLAVLSSGKPCAVSYIAQEAGITRPRAATAVRALADDGKVVLVGSRRQAKGGRQRLWELAP